MHPEYEGHGKSPSTYIELIIAVDSLSDSDSISDCKQYKDFGSLAARWDRLRSRGDCNLHRMKFATLSTPIAPMVHVAVLTGSQSYFHFALISISYPICKGTNLALNACALMVSILFIKHPFMYFCRINKRPVLSE